MNNSAVNIDIGISSDGFTMRGGLTNARTLGVTGGDIYMSGLSSYTYTFPGTGGTLALYSQLPSFVGTGGVSVSVVGSTYTIYGNSTALNQSTLGLSSFGERNYNSLASMPPQAYLGMNMTPNSAATIGATNRAAFLAVTNYSTCLATGVAFVVGTANGNVDVGVYNNSGTRLASSGSVATPAAGTRIVNFTAGVTLTPGIYWIAMSNNNATATYGRFGVDPIVGNWFFDTAFPLPTSVTFPGSQLSRCISMVLLLQGGVTL